MENKIDDSKMRVFLQEVRKCQMGNKIDYSKFNEIIVKSQNELDAIPLDFKGRIIIDFGDCYHPAILRNKYYLSVEVWGSSSVEARGNSSVVARGNSSVAAYDNSSVVARAYSSVVAYDNSSVVAYDYSSVVALGNSLVVAWGNSSVAAWRISLVVARENSSVEAYEHSSVEAYEHSSVVAYDHSSVVANANVQVVEQLEYNGKIQISGNARIVHLPKNIEDFMNFYGIKHTKTKAVFYKAVRKIGDKYFSDRDKNFEYIIGENKAGNGDTNTNFGYSYVIYISHLYLALNFGKEWDNLAILEVETEIKDIVLPENSIGDVRTSKVKVLRELPLSECGLYGKMIEKRKRQS